MLEPRIDDFPLLVARLGKARSDRIRYHQQGTSRRQGAGATNLINPFQEQLACLDRMPHALDDILNGVVRLIPSGDKPLSVSRLYTMLQCMPLINTREIQRMMDLGERQAQKYLQAAKLALPMMARHFDKNSLPPADRHTPSAHDHFDELPDLSQFSDVDLH